MQKTHEASKTYFDQSPLRYGRRRTVLTYTLSRSSLFTWVVAILYQWKAETTGLSELTSLITKNYQRCVRGDAGNEFTNATWFQRKTLNCCEPLHRRSTASTATLSSTLYCYNYLLASSVNYSQITIFELRHVSTGFHLTKFLFPTSFAILNLWTDRAMFYCWRTVRMKIKNFCRILFRAPSLILLLLLIQIFWKG